MARPTKLTKETQDKILRFIRMGVPFKDACQVAGINPDTGQRWLSNGRKAKEGIQYEFFSLVEQATAQFKALHVQNLNEISIGGKQFTETRTKKVGENIVEVITTTKTLLPDAGTSKWLLGRKFPDEWGRQREEANRILVELSQLSPDELINRYHQLITDIDSHRSGDGSEGDSDSDAGDSDET